MVGWFILQLQSVKEILQSLAGCRVWETAGGGPIAGAETRPFAAGSAPGRVGWLRPGSSHPVTTPQRPELRKRSRQAPRLRYSGAAPVTGPGRLCPTPPG